MEIRIQYQGIEGSPWMTKYLEGKLARLERYLSSAARIEIDLISKGDQCLSELSVKTLSHEYNFDKEGSDVFEAFSTALDEALMILKREHKKIREKYHNEIIDFIEP